MAESFLQLPPDSNYDATGKKLRSFSVLIGGQPREHQAVVLTDSNGNIIQSQVAPTVAATTSVPAAGADTVLLAANTARKGASITNDSNTATLLIKFGAGASATSFKVALPPNTGNGLSYLELPWPVYTGQINGFWTGVVAGNARISEET